MGKTCVVVSVIIANLADAIRASEGSMEQLTQSHAAKETAPKRGRPCANSKGYNVGMDRVKSYPLIPTIPSSASTPSTTPFSWSFEHGQRLAERLGLLRPWTKDTNRFSLDEADDAMSEKMRRGESYTSDASLNSSLVGVQNPPIDEEASRRDILTAHPGNVGTPFDGTIIDSALNRALEAYESFQQAIRDGVGAFPSIQRPDGNGEGEHADQEGSVKGASNRALQAYESLKQDPTIFKRCAAILGTMRQDLESARLGEDVGAYNKVMQRVLDQLQELEDKLVALTVERNDWAFQAYEPLKKECAVIFEEMRQYSEAAASQKNDQAYQKLMATVKQKRADLQRVTEKLQDLEDKFDALAAQKNCLASQVLNHAYQAYETLKPTSLDSIWLRAKGQQVETEPSQKGA